MLYFAYGSNLNHFQMKKRCKDSKYIKKFEIKDFRLTFRSKYGVADIESKKNYSIQGGLYEISKSDEKKIDIKPHKVIWIEGQYIKSSILGNDLVIK